MTLQEFVQLFANQFDETDPASITENTDFKNLDEWSSLLALSVIALADEEFNVKLSGDDLRSTKTVADLYMRIKAID